MNMLKHFLKDLVFEALYRSGYSSPGSMGADKHLILTFHRVLPESLRDDYPIPGLAVTPEALKWIIESLLPHFDVATVTDGHDSLRTRKTARPILSITFDDGQLDNFDYAAPVLDALGVPGTFYLPTDFIGTDKLLWHDEAAFAWSHFGPSLPGISDASATADGASNRPTSVPEFLQALKSLSPEARAAYMMKLRADFSPETPRWAGLMDWQQAKELVARGHEIGSHSLSHELLPQLDSESQKHELAASYEAIVARLPGVRPASFCYPNGDHSATTMALAAEVGYANAVTTHWGINDRNVPAFSLRRCDMDMTRLQDRSGALSAARLHVKLNGHQPSLG